MALTALNSEIKDWRSVAVRPVFSVSCVSPPLVPLFG